MGWAPWWLWWCIYSVHGKLVVTVALFSFATFTIFFLFLELQGKGEVVVFLLGSAEAAGRGGASVLWGGTGLLLVATTTLDSSPPLSIVDI